MTNLHQKITAYIKTSFKNPDEEVFNELALEVFRFQYAAIPVYQKLCSRRGVAPGSVRSWKNIPPLSTDGFKLFDLFTAPPGAAKKIFSTSGTTQGARKGRSFFSGEGLELMDMAIF